VLITETTRKTRRTKRKNLPKKRRKRKSRCGSILAHVLHLAGELRERNTFQYENLEQARHCRERVFAEARLRNPR
jgi:hypothetical protein